LITFSDDLIKPNDLQLQTTLSSSGDQSIRDSNNIHNPPLPPPPSDTETLGLPVSDQGHQVWNNFFTELSKMTELIDVDSSQLDADRATRERVSTSEVLTNQNPPFQPMTNQHSPFQSLSKDTSSIPVVVFQGGSGDPDDLRNIEGDLFESRDSSVHLLDSRNVEGHLLESRNIKGNLLESRNLEGHLLESINIEGHHLLESRNMAGYTLESGDIEYGRLEYPTRDYEASNEVYPGVIIGAISTGGGAAATGGGAISTGCGAVYTGGGAVFMGGSTVSTGCSTGSTGRGASSAEYFKANSTLRNVDREENSGSQSLADYNETSGNKLVLNEAKLSEDPGHLCNPDSISLNDSLFSRPVDEDVYSLKDDRIRHIVCEQRIYTQSGTRIPSDVSTNEVSLPLFKIGFGLL